MTMRQAGNTRKSGRVVGMVACLLAGAGAFVALASSEAAPSEATVSVTTPAAAVVANAVATAQVDMGAMVAERASALVTIKYILKDEGDEDEIEVPGTLIAADGLVITSNFFFPPGASPTELKIVHGEDTVGMPAKFIARDTELALAWLRVSEAPATPMPFIDFSKGAMPGVGDEVFAVRRMGKFFGLAPIINEGKVAAVTSKPRTLLIPTGGMSMRQDIAVAVFASGSGAPVGITSFIMPEEDEMAGPGNPMRGSENGMIVTASDVADATRRALENAASGAGEDASEEPEAAPAASEPAKPE